MVISSGNLVSPAFEILSRIWLVKVLLLLPGIWYVRKIKIIKNDLSNSFVRSFAVQVGLSSGLSDRRALLWKRIWFLSGEIPKILVGFGAIFLSSKNSGSKTKSFDWFVSSSRVSSFFSMLHAATLEVSWILEKEKNGKKVFVQNQITCGRMYCPKENLRRLSRQGCTNKTKWQVSLDHESWSPEQLTRVNILSSVRMVVSR